MSGIEGGGAAPGVHPPVGKKKRSRRYKKPDFITRWLIVTLGFAVAMTIVALISDFGELNLLDRALQGEVVTMKEATQNDERQGVIALIQIVVFLFATGLLITWTFRLYGNLAPLGATGLRRGRGWAIGGWFVPIANLFIPKEILNDIWRAGDPSLEMNSAQWRDGPVPPVLTVWWGAFLLATGAGQIAGGVATRSRSKPYAAPPWSSSRPTSRCLSSLSWRSPW